MKLCAKDFGLTDSFLTPHHFGNQSSCQPWTHLLSNSQISVLLDSSSHSFKSFKLSSHFCLKVARQSGPNTRLGGNSLPAARPSPFTTSTIRLAPFSGS